MKNPSKFETGSRIASGIRIMGSEGTLKKNDILEAQGRDRGYVRGWDFGQKNRCPHIEHPTDTLTIVS